MSVRPLFGLLLLATLATAQPPEQTQPARERAEAVAALRQKADAQRKVPGAAADLAATLEQLAGLLETQDDFSAAHKARAEVVAVRARLHGEKHWRTTDARWALKRSERRAALKPVERQHLDEADRLLDQVRARNEQSQYKEAVPAALRA